MAAGQTGETGPACLKRDVFRSAGRCQDTKATFANALEERGFWLAKGDKRGHVAVDWQGEVYAIARYVGVKTKDVRARLGDADELPSVDEVKQQIGKRLSEKLESFQADTKAQHEKRLAAWQKKRADLVAGQRLARDDLKKSQESRHITETKARASRLPTGLKALWCRITGKYKKIKKTERSRSKGH